MRESSTKSEVKKRAGSLVIFKRPPYVTNEMLLAEKLQWAWDVPNQALDADAGGSLKRQQDSCCKVKMSIKIYFVVHSETDGVYFL